MIFPCVQIKRKRTLLKLLITVLIFLLPVPVWAQCDFVTSRYALEMQQPQTVQHIDIKIIKSKKWALNGIKLVLDKEENINPKWKRKFSADVTVTYPFGTCMHRADLRQSGDWKDHIEFHNGKLRQSLDVELATGNIANAVEFKLFLPKTRLGNNETLATLILRKLNILSPKTFLINVSVNGVEGTYLFQEKESKELLEAMGRREGPMFEGDEELLWSFEDFGNFELEAVSGVRLVNDKWARRGESSALMALNAFQELQVNYLTHAATISGDRQDLHYLNPNQRITNTPTWPEYHAMIAAFWGVHSLRPHNRKFYWNALASEFEPLYYDGNVQFEAINPSGLFNAPSDFALFLDHLKLVDFASLKADVLNMQGDEFWAEFALLAKLTIDEAKIFAQPKLDQVINNLDALSAFISETPQPELVDISYGTARDQFFQRTNELGVEQLLVTPKSNALSGFIFECVGNSGCGLPMLDVEKAMKLISDQKYNRERVVVIPAGDFKSDRGAHIETVTEVATIRHSLEARVIYDRATRHLELVQSEADDWFLVRNVGLKNVTIALIGMEPEPGKTVAKQRFNEFGLTGCLTFYNVTFENVDVSVSHGACEDSVNLVSSSGTIGNISVEAAFADAIDLDFSEVQIGRVFANLAGNDCLDVSGGIYTFYEAILSDCSDKGISVGENSKMVGKEVIINTAFIGVSSKDYSLLKVEELAIQNVSTCLEAFQKKEEFGGATINIATENCDRSKITQGKNSTIFLGGDLIEFSN